MSFHIWHKIHLQKRRQEHNTRVIHIFFFKCNYVSTIVHLPIHLGGLLNKQIRVLNVGG